MPTYGADVLPDQAGRNLGSPSQPWNVYAQNLYVGGSQTVGSGSSIFSSVAYSATPTFTATSSAGFSMTLTGNVTSSTLSGSVPSGYYQTLIFRIQQDNVGGHSFAWPSNVFGGMTIDSTAAANQVAVQMFLWDGTNAYAVAPGTYY